MKTESAKFHFSWSFFFLFVVTYIVCTPLTTKLIDGIPWKDAYSLKNLVKAFIDAVFIAPVLIVVLKPSRRKKS